MNKNDKMIDDLIAHLDKSISLGVGHVNVKIENQSIMLEKIDQTEENLVKEVEVELPKETKVTQSTTVIIDDEDEEYIRNKKSMNSTMVFETEKLRKIIILN